MEFYKNFYKILPILIRSHGLMEIFRSVFLKIAISKLTLI